MFKESFGLNFDSIYGSEMNEKCKDLSKSDKMEYLYNDIFSINPNEHDIPEDKFEALKKIFRVLLELAKHKIKE